jgi:Fur family ferric uptake transcriptional regulator
MTTYRATPQRAAVAAAMDAVDGFASAQEVHLAMRKQGSAIGLSTVYRALQTLSDAGELDVLRSDDGEALYRRCGRAHHHHLVCRRCGRTEEVEGPEVETWAAQVASAHGYTEVSHTVEVFGLCAACSGRPG